jgi:polysaccharide biosynthesis/export protein
MRLAGAALATAMAFGMGGCAAGFLAEGGPGQFSASQSASLQVGSAAEQANLPFVLIAPSIELAMSLSGEPDRFGALPKRNQQEIRARIGDLVNVTIFEAGSGGLFTSPQAAGNSGGGGNFINLPAQAVGADGRISVPYAGSVRVAGRSPVDVQKEIEAKLRDRAIEPQVIVTINEERASMVTVLGSVAQGGRFPVRNTQIRILDAIARAGGPSGGTSATGASGSTSSSHEVVLQRSGHTSRVSLRRLVLEPSTNVSVLPGDTIFVQPINRAINVFGATGENSRVTIDLDNMTLTDALGRSKGFSDTRADVSSVFVLRMEDRRSIPANTDGLAHFTSATIPTVYQVRYDQPGGIFVGNHFRVRHGDVVYVSNASGVQARKLLELIGLVTRPVREIVGGPIIVQ